MLKLLDIYGNQVALKQWKFPAGELGIKILEKYNKSVVTIECKYQSSDDLMYLLLLVDAIRNKHNTTVINLVIPYFPYARQDRVCASGESFSLKVVANLISSCKFNKIIVWDAHSSVLQAFFDSGALVDVKQSELVQNFFEGKTKVALVSPDAGATKKIYETSKLTGFPVVEAQKIRCVNTGNIIETRITDTSLFESADELVILDDICDGGRTFIELAKVIRKSFNKKLTLLVTHGIFSGGFEELDKYFNEILFVNDLRKETNNANLL